MKETKRKRKQGGKKRLTIELKKQLLSWQIPSNAVHSCNLLQIVDGE